MDDNKKMVLTIPFEMHDALKKIAKVKGQTVSSLLRLAAAEWLERQGGVKQ